MYDERPSGGAIHGPMKEVNHDSLQYVDRADLEAIAVYIKSTIDDDLDQNKQSLAQATGEQKAKQQYQQYCAVCHDMGAGGAPKFAVREQWQSRLDARKRDGLVHSAIHGYGNMPAMGGCYDCTEQEIAAMVDYMLGALVTVAAREMGPPPIAMTAKDGQEIYQDTCSVCHDSGKLNAPVITETDQWSTRLKERGFLGLTLAVVQPDYYKRRVTDCAAKRGACLQCDDADIMAAVKYILMEAGVNGNFDLW